MYNYHYQNLQVCTIISNKIYNYVQVYRKANYNRSRRLSVFAGYCLRLSLLTSQDICKCAYDAVLYVFFFLSKIVPVETLVEGRWIAGYVFLQLIFILILRLLQLRHTLAHWRDTPATEENDSLFRFSNIRCATSTGSFAIKSTLAGPRINAISPLNASILASQMLPSSACAQSSSGTDVLLQLSNLYTASPTTSLDSRQWGLIGGGNIKYDWSVVGPIRRQYRQQLDRVDQLYFMFSLPISSF